MKKYFIGGGLVLLGFVFGALMTAWLASRASVQYLESIRSILLVEQHVLAARANADKQTLWEIVHYRNVVDLSSPKGLKTFARADSQWPITFPFIAPVLKRMADCADSSGMGRRRIEGLNHGYLALALDEFGLSKEADAEWEKAFELNDVKDAERFKATMRRLEATQSMWLKLESYYTFPKR